MPLIPMDQQAELRREGRQPVLVFTDGNRSMGLVVDEIVDIVEDRINVEVRPDSPALMGSAVIAGKATDVIDAGHYLTQAFGDWFDQSNEETLAVTRGRRLLVVDDSAFFRNLLTPLLSVAGYEVTAVEGGEQAMALCERGDRFDAIISDIEMPGMNGFQLAEAVRADSRWGTVPIVALSSHTTAETGRAHV